MNVSLSSSDAAMTSILSLGLVEPVILRSEVPCIHRCSQGSILDTSGEYIAAALD